MAKYVFNLPDVGEGIVEGEIVKWNVKPGDTVKEDEPLVELMTDKATVSIPSSVNGKVVSTTGKPGDMVPVGAELIVFEVKGAGGSKPKLKPKAEPVQGGKVGMSNLLISTCSEKLSEREFVFPIVEIVKPEDYEVLHYTECT